MAAAGTGVSAPCGPGLFTPMPMIDRNFSSVMTMRSKGAIRSGGTSTAFTVVDSAASPSPCTASANCPSRLRYSCR